MKGDRDVRQPTTSGRTARWRPEAYILPDDWEMMRLRHLSDTYPSGVDKKVEEDELEVELCNYTDVYYNEFIGRDQEFMKATATDREVSRFRLQEGDVLLTKDSEDWKDIGVPALIQEDLPGVLCGYHLFLSRPDPSVMDPSYLLRAIQSGFVAFQLEGAATGVTRFGLTTGDVRDAWIPVPPLPTQEQIASFLDNHTARIDRLVGKKERLLELLEEKREALVARAVTEGLDEDEPMEPVEASHLRKIPKEWDLIPLKYLTKMDGGKTPSTEKNRYWGGDIPWFTPKDMKVERIETSQERLTDSAIEETRISTIPPNAVLVVVRGMILDHTFPVALTQRSGTINQDMKALFPDDRLSSEYLFRLLQGLSPAILALVEESAHGTKKLDSDVLKQFEVPVPPRAVQDELLSALDEGLRRLDRLSNRAHSTVELLTEKRQALITAAVIGQTDVSDWQPQSQEATAR